MLFLGNYVMIAKLFKSPLSKIGAKIKQIKLKRLWNKAVKGRKVNISLIARKLYLMVLDIETIGAIGSQIPYDIGITIITNLKKVVYTIALIISDIFDNDNLMQTAYYKEKISFYKSKLITDSNYVKQDVVQVINQLQNIFNHYAIPVYFAYNGSFDRLGLINLYDTYINDNNNFLKNIKVVDIMYVATQVILKNVDIYEEYMYFCYTNGFITPSGKNISFNAESVFAFLMNRPIFAENHTGLEDTFCEKDLLLMLVYYYEYKYHKDLIINCLDTNQTTSLIHYTKKGGALNVDKAEQITQTKQKEKNNKKGFFSRIFD